METLDSILKMFTTVMFTAYIITNICSVGLLIGSYRWPVGTRIIFVLIFSFAAFFNLFTVLKTPWAYLNFADYALPLYSKFILGLFSEITVPMVVSISLGQLIIALTMLMKGFWFQAGCLGGFIFCLAIAPLGIGAAFPAPLVMAFAFYRLYRNERSDHNTLPQKQVFLSTHKRVR